MRRFFSKKSVAVILATTLLFCIFGLPATFAQETTSTTTSSFTDTLASFAGNLVNYTAGAASFSFITPWIAVLTALNVIIAAFVAIMGFIFDMSIQIAVIHMKVFFDGNGAVNTLWTLIRDMINISFIFVLLYTAITQIIGAWGIKAKTTLMSIIISAIFINFSLFFTKILIDAGNMVALQLFDQISPAGVAAGISGMIIKGTSILDNIKSALSLTGQTNMIISLVMQLITMAIMIWVFLYFSSIMIGRTIMLMFLAITSPIGFIFGNSVPFLSSLSSKWWENLTNQILVAPFVMFFLFFLEKIIANKAITNAIAAARSNAALAGLGAPAIDVGGFFIYIMIVMLLLKGLKIAKEMSGAAGALAVKVIGAAAVAATAAVGGAVVGGSMLSSGAAAAGRAAASQAGGGLLSKTAANWGGRLAFSTKNIGEVAGAAGQRISQSTAGSAIKSLGETTLVKGVGKFVTGDYEKTGVAGLAQGYLREKAISGIKEATGGTIDLKALEKTMKEGKKTAEKNISEAAEKAGPQKAIDREKQLMDMEENIRIQAEKRIDAAKKSGKSETEITAMKESERQDKESHEAAKKEKTKTEKTLKDKEKAVKDTQEKLNKTPQNAPQWQEAQKAHVEAQKAEQQARADFSSAESKVKVFEDKEKASARLLEKEMEVVAAEMGMETIDTVRDAIDVSGNIVKDSSGNSIKETVKSALSKIKEERKELEGKIIEKTKERNEYITKLATEGSYLGTLLNADDRKKLVDKLRAQKGKYNAEKENLGKNVLKALKDAGINVPSEEKKEEKKESGDKK